MQPCKQKDQSQGLGFCLLNTGADCRCSQSGATVARLSVAEMLAPIKSQQDLERYLKLTAASATPLRFLSNSARAEFLGSLTFNEKGVTGFKFSSLESELNPTKIAEFFRFLDCNVSLHF